ncbi:hypothetical protein IAT38_008069 [Cryptococcus sp. DSM 104549]
MSGGFFGFDTTLPDQRAPQQQQQQDAGRTQFAGFQTSGFDQTFALGGNPEQEDLEVYNWNDAGAGGLLEESVDVNNDDTFGDSATPAFTAGGFFDTSASTETFPRKGAQAQGQRGPIASTASRYKPKAVKDPFAFSEDDFYSARPAKKAPVKAKAAPQTKPAGNTVAWGAAPSSTIKPSPAPAPRFTQPSVQPPPGQIKTLEEIEAEMAGLPLPSAAVLPPPATYTGPAYQEPVVVSLEDLERDLMEAQNNAPAEVPQAPPQQQQQQQQHAVPQQQVYQQQPVREATPTQVPGLPGSGYSSQQALLDSMFPELGKAPGPAPPQPSQGPDAGLIAGEPALPQPSPEELAHRENLRKILAAKISAMSKYNNLMGSSDKDFITRIQLSQLATSDPYVSDFYAQVFSALKRSRMAHESGQVDKPTVVSVAAGFGFGVGGPVGNRFGKMGQNTMTKLSTQVKKLVESRAQHQKVPNAAALQGALGRVTRGNAAAPRPVLAVPTSQPENRPTSHINQQTGIHRAPLTRKQAMYALEGLYSDVLELEQMRRDAPASAAMEEVEIWDLKCRAKVDMIWNKLMATEPLEISNPHPFISILNIGKGQRLFGRILRHLSDRQLFTLLSLLVVTFPQLDVVAHAPPPPVADASFYTNAERMDRAKREAETDMFLHSVIPAMDIVINKCGLGLLGGLLVAATQMVDAAKIASTRPGVALFTALLSKAQSIIRSPPPDPMNPQQVQAPDATEVENWSRNFSIFLHHLLPHLPELFPSSVAAKATFGPSAYLITGEALSERDAVEMERREAEVWGLAAALAMNAAEAEQTDLVASLREKILHTVQSSRQPGTSPARAEMKLRNVNVFLNGLGLDAAMIE